MDPILISIILLSFFTTLFFLPFWIRKAKEFGLIWADMHKVGHPKNVAGSGGIAVLLGFIIATLVYVFVKSFILSADLPLTEIFALLATVILAGVIGFIDDIMGWIKGGLGTRVRIILLIVISVPLVIINAGESTMMGIEFGLFYPLFFIPLGIVAVTSSFNLLAGYNGLEASQGILLLSALGIFTYLTGNPWLSVIAAFAVASLIAFYIFNKVPAKVFPGDVLTYPIGALIACIVILGNIEKFGAFIFMLYIAEVVLKSRGKLKKESFAKVKEDGTLINRYKKFYGLEHIAVAILNKVQGKAEEKCVVRLINLVQLIIIIIGFVIFL